MIHIRGSLELELQFANGTGVGPIRVIEVYPKKKSTGYWVCRLPGVETPEPTVVLSILNAEWLYVHCVELRRYLTESTADRTLQALLNEVFVDRLRCFRGNQDAD